MMMPEEDPIKPLMQRAPLLRYSLYSGVGLSALVVALALLNPYEMDKASKESTAVVQQSVPPPIQVHQPTGAVSPETSGGANHPTNLDALNQVPAPTTTTGQSAPPAGGTTAAGAPISVPAPTTFSQYGAQPAQITPPAAVPSNYPSAALSSTSSSLIGFVSGIPQSDINDCQSTAYREPSRSVNPGTTQVHLPGAGLWCFFDASGSMYDIRMEAPFQGNVAGIRIGDTVQRVQQQLGAPIKKLDGPLGPSLFFSLKGPFMLRVQPDPIGVVQTMYLVR